MHAPRAAVASDPATYLRALRSLAPKADHPIVGKTAICAWLLAHGFGVRGKPPKWRTVLEWQNRTGPMFFPQRNTRAPLYTTHLVLLVWALTLSEGLGRAHAARARRSTAASTHSSLRSTPSTGPDLPSG